MTQISPLQQRQNGRTLCIEDCNGQECSKQNMTDAAVALDAVSHSLNISVGVSL